MKYRNLVNDMEHEEVEEEILHSESLYNKDSVWFTTLRYKISCPLCFESY